MQVFNPFQIAPISSLKDFGSCFLIVGAVFSLFCYFIAWTDKITYRKLVELSMYLTPILMCWIFAILYWYFAIFAFILIWLLMLKIKNLCLKIVSSDESSGITATSSRKRALQEKQWAEMAEEERENFLSNLSIHKRQNTTLVLILSILAPILMIIVFSRIGLHYHFY